MLSGQAVQARSLTDYGSAGFDERVDAAMPYDVDYSYDANGNLLTLQRRDAHTAVQDNLTYEYNAGTNRLRNTDPADGENYTYDEIGNLISDNAEGIESIAWTPYGKVRAVTKDDNSEVRFRYDAAGNRIAKIASGDTTVYVRDASGNVMGVYKNDTLIEQSIYGSSRLGLMTSASKTGHRTLGGKKYELSNHLGNVLAVVSDNINFDQDSTWASVVNVTDYYPFGLAMDGRSLQDSTYRYGFNGKEEDSPGMGGGGSTYDYGFRIYNPEIGKFLSVDPLTKSYPELTPYQFASNTPIYAIDLDGLEAVSYQWEVRGMYGLGVISVTSSHTVGVIVDIHGNVASFYTPTVGAGAGEGFVAAGSISVFPNAETVEDIKGMGFTAGAFYANPFNPMKIGGVELNVALNDDLSVNTIGGTGSAIYIPGPNFGMGAGGYLEGSYTFMSDIVNIENLHNSEIMDSLSDHFGIGKESVVTFVEGLYSKTKSYEKQNSAVESIDLNNLLKERNLSPKDATNLDKNKTLIDK